MLLPVLFTDNHASFSSHLNDLNNQVQGEELLVSDHASPFKFGLTKREPFYGQTTQVIPFVFLLASRHL